MPISVRLLTSASEILSARNLIEAIFWSHITKTYNDQSFRDHLWKPYTFNPLTGLIGAFDDSSGELIGVLRILFHTLYLNKKRYSAAGLTNICVVPQYRGKGVMKSIFKFTYNYLKDLQIQLCFLISRKAVDGLYCHFGFIGVSSYPQVSIQFSAISSRTTDFCFNLASKEDLSFCMTIYDTFLGSHNGMLYRSLQDWMYIFDRLQFLDRKLYILYKNGVKCGYFVFDGSTVYEIYSTSLISSNTLMPLCNEATLSIIGNLCELPLFDFTDYDFSFRQRFCPYGGLMYANLNLNISDLITHSQYSSVDKFLPESLYRYNNTFSTFTDRPYNSVFSLGIYLSELDNF